MTKARRSEGPCAPLFYSAAAMLLLFGKISTAQTVDLSTLELCASLETPEFKLACFEALIATGRTPAAEVPEVDVAGGAESAPVATEPEVPVAVTPENAPAAVEPEVAVAVTRENASAAIEPEVAAVAGAPENAPDAIETEPDTADIQVATETTAMVSGTPSDNDFGREQLTAPDQEQKKEVIKAMVVDVTQGYNKLLYFHLANGHVWRQIEVRRFQYPKSGEFEINISRGMMGEYRMRIGDKGQMVRIRRVE